MAGAEPDAIEVESALVSRASEGLETSRHATENNACTQRNEGENTPKEKGNRLPKEIYTWIQKIAGRLTGNEVEEGKKIIGEALHKAEERGARKHGETAAKGEGPVTLT